MATLEVCTDTDGRQFFELTADEMVVGRDQFCDIVLRNHTVSRQHARIVRSADGYLHRRSLEPERHVPERPPAGRPHAIKDQDRIHIYEVVTVFHAGTPRAERSDAGRRRRRALEDGRRCWRKHAEREPRLPPACWLRTGRGRQRTGRGQLAGPLSRGAQDLARISKAGSTSTRSCPRSSTACSRFFRRPSRGYILLAEGSDGHLVPRAMKHRKSETGHSMTFGPISRKTALHVMSTGEAIIMAEGGDSAADMNQSVFEHAPLVDDLRAVDGSLAAGRWASCISTRPIRTAASCRPISTCWWPWPRSRGRKSKSAGSAQVTRGGQQLIRRTWARPSRCSCSSCRSAGPRWPAISSTTTISRPMRSAATTSAIFRCPTAGWRWPLATWRAKGSRRRC